MESKSKTADINLPSYINNSINCHCIRKPIKTQRLSDWI